MEIDLSNFSEQINLSDYFFKSIKIEATAIFPQHFQING